MTKKIETKKTTREMVYDSIEQLQEIKEVVKFIDYTLLRLDENYDNAIDGARVVINDVVNKLENVSDDLGIALKL